MENLYHYTDFKAMNGIIANGEIWLWNLRRMNDSQEMEYFINSLKCAVQNLLEDDLVPSMEKMFSENLKDFDRLTSFAACFSEYSDDAAQWSRYAKNGMGVCIAFNRELLSRIGQAGHAPLCQVTYAKGLESYGMASTIASMIRNPGEYSQEKIKETFNQIVSNSPLFKHPSFISEKEYRLVSLPYHVEEHLGKPHFYVEETNIKKYYVLSLRNVCADLGIPFQDLFNEVCIGPQARVTREVLVDYFISLGMESLAKKVRISDCPLKRF